MRDEGDIVLVIDRSPLRKPHQHRTSRSDLAGSDQKAQVAGAGDENSAQHRALLEDRGKDDHALIVDCRKTEAVEGAAARRWIATRHELAQHAAAVKIKHLQRFATSPHRSDKSDFIPIVEHRRIKFDESAVLHAGRVGSAQRDGFEAAIGCEKNPLGGACSGNARTKCDLAGIIQRRNRMPRKFRQNAAPGDRIADGCRFRYS